MLLGGNILVSSIGLGSMIDIEFSPHRNPIRRDDLRETRPDHVTLVGLGHFYAATKSDASLNLLQDVLRDFGGGASMAGFQLLTLSSQLVCRP